MSKKLFIAVLLLTLLQFIGLKQDILANPNIPDRIIGKVNNEPLFKSQFNRLYNAQIKSFHDNYLFSPLTNHENTPEIDNARKELLVKAKINGLTINEKEFNDSWTKYLQDIGGLEQLTKYASNAGVTIEFIKNKIKDNTLLDKFFKEESKHKLAELMIDEKLVLQEAEKRSLYVPTTTINEKLGKIIDKEGGQENFNRFLLSNNATINDAKKEIENKLLYELVKTNVIENIQITDFEIQDYYVNHVADFKNIPLEHVKSEIIKRLQGNKGEETFNSLLRSKKFNAEIIVYSNDIFQDKPTLPPQNIQKNIQEKIIPKLAENTIKELPIIKEQPESVSIRSKSYPTITRKQVQALSDTFPDKKQPITGNSQPKLKQEPEKLAELKLNNGKRTNITEEILPQPETKLTENTKEKNPFKNLSVSKFFKKRTEKQSAYQNFPVPSAKLQKELDEAIKIREKVIVEKTIEPINQNIEDSITQPQPQLEITKQPLEKDQQQAQPSTAQQDKTPQGKYFIAEKQLRKEKANPIPENNIQKPARQTIEIIGHRGNPYLKVENTLESIYSAWANGADAVEIDLQLTKDNEAILFHDMIPKTDTSAGFSIQNHTSKYLNEFSWQELQEAVFHKNAYEKEVSKRAGMPITLQIKHPVIIPKLDDVTIPPQKKLYLELKCKGMDDSYKTTLATKIVDWIKAHNYYNNTKVISFDSICLDKIKKLNNQVSTGLLIENQPTLNVALLKNVKASLNIDTLMPSFKDTNADLISACHQAGLQIIPWVMHESTSDEVSEMLRLMNSGIAGLITNQPTALQRLLSQSKNNKPTTIKTESPRKIIPLDPPKSQDISNDRSQRNNNTDKQLNNLNVFRDSQRNITNSASETLQSDLEELKRKINQRRVSKKEN